MPKPRGSFNNTRNSKDNKLLFKNAIPRIDIEKKFKRDVSVHSVKVNMFENSRNKVIVNNVIKGSSTGHRSAQEF